MKTLIKITLFAAVTAFMLACSGKTGSFKMPKKDLMAGLASPVTLNPDTTRVYISDYFPTRPEIDSITVSSALSSGFNDTIIRLVTTDKAVPKISLLKIYTHNYRYDILLKASEKVQYEFTFQAGKQYDKVQLKGEFNGWNPGATPLTKNGNLWTTTLTLSPGEYQYLIVADGREMLDPDNPDSISNNMGGYNSVLKAGKYGNLNKPHLISVSQQGNSFKIRSTVKFADLIVLCQNRALPGRYVTIDNQQISVELPQALSTLKRSYVRLQAVNSDGFSNNLLVPLHKGKVLNDPEQLTRTDFEAATIYNVFIDRFKDGDTTNTEKIKNDSIHPKANYFGGDINGIIQKIHDGYFRNLGINTIWISPIVKNPEEAYGLYPEPRTKFSAYHGYWPVSFTQINPHFGTEEDLHKLVKTAHKNDLNVLLDFVANHVHENHPVIEKHPDWKTNLYLPDGTLNTEKWDSHRLTTWFDTFLPTLDLTRPKVTDMLTDSAVYWIKKYNLDGFRHDATKHIPENFWRTLTRKLRKEVVIPENRRLYQIGETYGSPELIGSYVNSGQLDAQFDFNVYDATVGALTNNRTLRSLVNEIAKSRKYYGAHHLMGNITGNQDRARFISYASGALSFDEDAKKAGWTREITVEDTVGYDKAAMLNAIVSTIPGLPVVYYGDEIGMPGGNDPDNRRMMRFEDLIQPEKELKKITATLLNFRQKALPLIFGDFKVKKVTENILIYQRTYFDETVLIAINNSDENDSIEMQLPKHLTDAKFYTLFGHPLQKSGQQLQLKLNAYDFEVITNINSINSK